GAAPPGEEFLPGLGQLSPQQLPAVPHCKADAVHVSRQKAKAHGVGCYCAFHTHAPIFTQYFSHYSPVFSPGVSLSREKEKIRKGFPLSSLLCYTVYCGTIRKNSASVWKGCAAP